VHLRLVVLAAGIALAGLASAFAQAPPTQLDRIEQKLDTILHKLDQLSPDQAAGANPAQPSAESGRATSPGVSPAPEALAGGALAIVHAAPATPTAAHEIPPDSVGGFIYTSGPLQLADLADHGVRYTGLVGVELQGWLRAKETGRYQFGLDGSTVSANNFTNSTCVFTGWLEDRAIGVQEAALNSGPTRPAPFSLVLGAELQPGLYKLRFWATCTPTRAAHDQRVSVALLEKAPSDLNLRPITGEDLVHKQDENHQSGASRR
jgi:hypothetical protein